MRGIAAVHGMSGITPDWIKSIEDTLRPTVKEFGSSAATQAATRATAKPAASAGVPATGGVPTTNATPYDAGAGYFEKAGQWVKENPGTALTLAAVTIGLFLKLKK